MIAARSAGSDHAKTQNSNANESCQINTLPPSTYLFYSLWPPHTNFNWRTPLPPV
jgi:hypothetical protein